VTKPTFNKSLAVGALVAVAGAAFLVAFTFFKKGGYSEDESYLVHAYFSDATGLTWKSRVQIAGIQIGEVAKISLEGDRARLDLRIKKTIDLRRDACLTKTFPSALLPDALLEASAGSGVAQSLQGIPVEQRELTCVRESTSVQKLIDSLSKIAADVQVVTGDLAKTVGGTQGSIRDVIENLSRLTRRLDDTVAANQGRLNSILANVDVISGDLRELTQGEKERVKQIAKNVEDLTAQLKLVAESARQVMDGTTGAGPAGSAAGTETRPGPGGSSSIAPTVATAGGGTGTAADQARGVRQAVEKMNTSLAKLDDLLGKLQEGKSVGSRLLTDERMGRQLAESVEAAALYVKKLDQLQIEVQLRSEWLLNQTGAKTYAGITLLPRPDKYYIFEVVSDPRGVDTVTTETVVTPDATGKDVVTNTTKTKHEQALTFTLEMAKRYGPVSFRVGVIESSGGVGADLHLLDDALTVSMSVYQFSRPYQDIFPRAKVSVDYHFLQHFYATAGADDFLNQWKSGRYPGGPKFTIGNDVFFGGGLSFTDDDLKTLLGSGAGSLVSASSSSGK
jgi:phospholipid/cholesterol/gamma-HCH transport system substrate-binding protein